MVCVRVFVRVVVVVGGGAVQGGTVEGPGACVAASCTAPRGIMPGARGVLAGAGAAGGGCGRDGGGGRAGGCLVVGVGLGGVLVRGGGRGG